MIVHISYRTKYRHPLAVGFSSTDVSVLIFTATHIIFPVKFRFAVPYGNIKDLQKHHPKPSKEEKTKIENTHILINFFSSKLNFSTR